MSAADIPPDEAERLADLRDLRLIEGVSGDLFDGFTRVAADLFGVPMAAVSLIESDTQLLQATCGLGGGAVPREHSFCAHAILHPQEVMVVPDAAQDSRFADNPLVRGEPHIRFYAGAPIVTERGHAVGALCVADRTPRQVPQRAHERLRDLARGVSAAMALRRALKQVSMAALTDPLTGLGNRKALDHALAEADSPCALLALDLDRFKAINEASGHAGGNAALVEVAQRLKAVTRPEDLLFRPGGDEFCVLLRDVPGPAVARIADRIHGALAQPFAIAGTPVALRASIGTAVRTDPSAPVTELVERADAALYAAKRAGRGVTRCADEIGLPGLGRHGMEEALHAAFAPGGEGSGRVPFHLRFQPILSLRDGRVRSAEALLRWEIGGQLIPPGDFLPVLENLGYAGALDRWAIWEACRAAATLPGLVVSANVSAGSFAVPGFAAMVGDCLAAHGLPGERLLIEMTETALAGDAEEALAQIMELADAGVRVCLDDFGGGHGTLARMRRYPFAHVKLDHALVDGCERDRLSATLVEAVSGIADALAIGSVAEGVENEAQLRAVAAAGVTFVQGYLLSPAVPLADLPRAMREASGTVRRILHLGDVPIAA